MPTVTPFSTKGYEKNERLVASPLHACAHCGKAVDATKAKWVVVAGGGARYVMVGEKLDDPNGGYMGTYAVGPDCAKKLVEAGVMVGAVE